MGCERGWEITGEIEGRCYKKVIRSPRSTANGTAESELLEKSAKARCFVVQQNTGRAFC
jgi:hypothetical protein